MKPSFNKSLNSAVYQSVQNMRSIFTIFGKESAYLHLNWERPDRKRGAGRKLFLNIESSHIQQLDVCDLMDAQFLVIHQPTVNLLGM